MWCCDLAARALHFLSLCVWDVCVCVCVLCVCVCVMCTWTFCVCQCNVHVPRQTCGLGGQPWKLVVIFHLGWDKGILLSVVWAKLAPSLWILLSVSPISLKTGISDGYTADSLVWALGLELGSFLLSYWATISLSLAGVLSKWCCHISVDSIVKDTQMQLKKIPEVTTFSLEKYFFYQCEHASWKTLVSIT